MDLKTVLELLEAVESTGWKKFEMSEKDFSLKLERGGADQPAALPAQAVPAAVPTPQPPMPDQMTYAQQQEELERLMKNPTGADGAQAITSPVIGIFHKLPGDKEVKIGDKVKKGAVICMVEAMKLMNEIHMPEDGEIVWIAAQENDMVEYDQLLFSYVTA